MLNWGWKGLRRRLDLNIEFGSGNGSPAKALDLEEGTVRKVEGSDGIFEDRRGKTEVEHGSEEHVAADAGKAIEIKRTRHA
jgi:hypothetical protein